jgi:hypothetical protein
MSGGDQNVLHSAMGTNTGHIAGSRLIQGLTVLVVLRKQRMVHGETTSRGAPKLSQSHAASCSVGKAGVMPNFDRLTMVKTACCNCDQLSKRTLEFSRRVTRMDMMGRVGLIEIPVLIAPDQKAWMDRMIKEGKIAIPPGGTLEKGSLYSMFIRMLLHNAMEEQKRQEALEAEDEDDE